MRSDEERHTHSSCRKNLDSSMVTSKFNTTTRTSASQSIFPGDLVQMRSKHFWRMLSRQPHLTNNKNKTFDLVAGPCLRAARTHQLWELHQKNLCVATDDVFYELWCLTADNTAVSATAQRDWPSCACGCDDRPLAVLNGSPSLLELTVLQIVRLDTS